MVHDIQQLVAQHGAAIVFVNVLLEQIGLPIPAVPTLMVAGAVAADGKLSPPLLFTLSIVASLLWPKKHQEPVQAAGH